MELVHKLTRLHHGAITVDSRPEEFTRFEVLLPLERSQYNDRECAGNQEPLLFVPAISESGAFTEEEILSPSPEPVKVNQQAGKPTVLLVEDNRELRKMMQEILREYYVVLEAGNGREGFDLALNEQPQIIISDILMPVEDGITLLKRLKLHHATLHIPVFLLTAKVTDDVKRESIQLGAEDFIEKPFSMEFLQWKVANALKTRRLLEQKYSRVITTAPSEVELESPDERLVRDLVQLIEDHMEDPKLSVEFLAGQVGMSRANLYRKLQKIMNETPVSFIRKLKLQRAQQILAMDKFYISEVAYMCGFKSQRYFSKCFVREFGCTPSQFQEEKRVTTAG